MQQSTIKQKILLIILSLFVAALIGEGLFRIGGLLVNGRNSNDLRKNESYRIICIGDSTTYGIGASNINKFSYPSQLQNILNENSVNKNFEVINLGSPGMNSSQVLNRFEKNIFNYKPDMVIMMVGINDPWNFEESNILKFYDMTTIRKFYMRMELLLNQLKLYQFIKLIYLSDKFNEISVPNFNDRTINKAIDFYEEDPVRAEAFNMMILNNIADLKQIAEDNNAKIIFMKYHNIGWGRPELIIHDTYDQLNVQVVDNELLFKKAKQLGLNVWGNDKWHPNDLGYLFVAKNIFNKLVALKILNADAIDILNEEVEAE